MRYRGVEYIKIAGYWRARPGQGTGERAAGRRKKKSAAKEPATFWECVNEKTGRSCGTKHRGRTACGRHARELNRRAWHVGGRSAQTWTPFKVVNGTGYHYGVGAPRT